MHQHAILLPVFVQVALTFALWFWMAYYRVTLLRSRAVQPHEVALREPKWPPHALQVGNAAHNQLETPLLFYVLAILLVATSHANTVFVALAWLYVALRLAHACIHVTSNRVAIRGPVFGLSLLVLFVMWIVFALRILAGMP